MNPGKYTPLMIVAMLLTVLAAHSQDTIIGYSNHYVLDTRLEPITGLVVDAETGNRIALAEIFLTGQSQNFSVLTDEDGAFSVGPVGQGVYNLSAIKPGYLNYTENITITSDPGQSIVISLDPADSFSLAINSFLTVKADNFAVGPDFVYTLTGNVNINEMVYFGGQLTVDMRPHLIRKRVYGSDSIFVPDVDNETKVISAGNTSFDFYVLGNGLYASGPGSFFELPNTLGGFALKMGAMLFDNDAHAVRLKAIPSMPYPVDFVFERYMGLGLPTKNLLDYVSGTFIYTIGGAESVEFSINNLSANLGPVGIQNLSLWYLSENQVFGGSLSLKISASKKEKDPEPDTTRVVIKNEQGEVVTEMPFYEFVDKLGEKGKGGFEIEMTIEFVNGALNQLSVTLSDIRIPIFTTGMVITKMHGGVYDLVTDDWYLEATVDIEPATSTPGFSPVKLADFGVMIQPMDVFRGGGAFEVFGTPVGGGMLEYNRPLKSISLEGYFTAYAGILKGQIYAGLKPGQFIGSGLMTVQTPPIHCSFYRPWLCWISWAGNRHIGSASVDINNTSMRSMIALNAGKLGTLSLAQRLEYGSGFDYYIGTNYNNMVKIIKGTKDGEQFYRFLVPENTPSLMVSANDTITYQMFDFSLMSPDSVVYGSSHPMYQCFEESQMCVMIINLPTPGEWTFFTDYQGDFNLFTQGLDQPPVGMANQPNDRKSRSNAISLNLNDHRDTLSVQVFYNTHNREFNGTLINEFTVINNATLDFTWNNDDIPNGEYFIYTRIDDQKNAPVLQYAPGSIWVENTPGLVIPQNLSAVQDGNQIIVSWDELFFNDDIYATAVYYKDMSTFVTEQVTVLDENQAILSDLIPGRGYRIWGSFINNDGDYSVSDDFVEVIFTSQTRNNPPFFAMDRDSTFVFVTGEESQYFLNAIDADGDMVTFSLPGDTLGISISGNRLSWNPQQDQTGVFHLKIVVTDGAETDTTYQKLAVYAPEQIATRLAFNSVYLYELDNTFLRLYNFYATDPTQQITLTNLRTKKQKLVTARKVGPYEYIGQFYVSVQKYSEIVVADGDTIVATYSYKDASYETMAFCSSELQESDITPPGTITDMEAERLSGNQVVLTWTAPGNDSDQGKAYRYDIRYAFEPITSEDVYFTAYSIANSPYPSVAGAIDSMQVNLIDLENITENQTVYFSIKAEDAAQNRSLLSNSPGIIAAPDPFNVTAEITGVFTVYINWEGPVPAPSGQNGLSHYKLYRRYNNGAWTVVHPQLMGYPWFDNLKVFPDGDYQYAISAVYGNLEGDKIVSPVVTLDRFTDVNILCAAEGAENNGEIDFKMTGQDLYYTQSFERTTQPTGLVMLNKVFKTNYIIEMSKEYFVTLYDTITVSSSENAFAFTLYCDPLTPIDLWADDVTIESAVLNWNAQSFENQWDILYGPMAFDPELTGTLVEGVTTMPFTLTGLIPGQPMHIYVRAVCGENVSDWSAPVSVTTAHAIIASAGAGGSIVPDGFVAITPGENYSFSIVPEVGYHINDVFIDGVSIGAVDSYIFLNADVTHSIRAEFSINIYSISAEPNEFAYGSVLGTGDFEHGQSVNLEAVPNPNYVFLRWTEDDLEVADTPQLDFLAESDRSLVAHFDSDVGAETVLDNETGLFPNPFSHTITIKNATEVRRMVITNLLSQVMLDVWLPGGDSEIVSTQGLPGGFYIVTLTTAGGDILLKKMVKE